MSWIDSELPAEWPQKSTDAEASTPEFSTSQSGSESAAPTVAVQSGTTKTPPWRNAVNLGTNRSFEGTNIFNKSLFNKSGSQNRLTNLFLPHDLNSKPASHSSANSGIHASTNSSSKLQLRNIHRNLKD